jgi:hypothetical protein
MVATLMSTLMSMLIAAVAALQARARGVVVSGVVRD